MRCTCCNRVLNRSQGYRVMEDGTKVEEDFCTSCRHEVSLIMTSGTPAEFVQFDGIIEQQLRYGSVTPQRNPSY